MAVAHNTRDICRRIRFIASISSEARFNRVAAANMTKYCTEVGCKTQPSYCEPGKYATRCSQHKLPGMEKRRKDQDCQACASSAFFCTSRSVTP